MLGTKREDNMRHLLRYAVVVILVAGFGQAHRKVTSAPWPYVPFEDMAIHVLPQRKR